MKKALILSTALLCGVAANAAGRADSLLQAVEYSNSGLWLMADAVFDNVAIDQWRLPLGYTAVNGSYNRRERDYSWQGSASTYTHYRSSTLCGGAAYSNGKRRNMPWCETTDPELLYPYLLADTVGGDLNSEIYTFSGSYADHSDRWAWGASLAYKATLEYRSVDPRPRNVAGCLDASAAIAYRLFDNYWLGGDLTFRRYTQSNDIEFKSEMGIDKIYHLTGPESHYARFAGVGLSTHYRGYRYGGGLTLYPASGRGFFIRAATSRFSFDNIITDLNKLPMASATHYTFEAMAGYLHPGEGFFWGANARLQTARRHGTENIFGDASSGVYPQIGSLQMYSHNSTTLSASVLGGICSGRSQLWLRLTPGYSYESTAYRSPRYYLSRRTFTPRAELSWSGRMVPCWLFMARAAYERTPLYSHVYSMRAGAAYMLGQRLGLSVDGCADFMPSGRKNYTISLGLIF